MRAVILLLAGLAMKIRAQATEERAVVAHFMIGIISSYTLDDWTVDIKAAQEAGIDAFALNCANEPQTDKQIPLAFQAAESLNFKAFFSFDMNSYDKPYWGFENTGNQEDTRPIIINLLNTYADSPAYFTYGGKAVISGFSGDTFPWQSVLDSYTGQTPLSLMPNYQQTASIQSSNLIDGALSWFAWPTDGSNGPANVPMTTEHDEAYRAALGANRVYIAPVAPWFFTHLSTSADFGNGKNWLFVSEDLLHTRWQQILAMPQRPQIVELVTWNDYGESHYLGPMNRKYPGYDDGSSTYANDAMPHDALRALCKLYIQAFKSGTTEPVIDQNEIFYWHRPSPKAAIASADPLGRPNGADMVGDLIFVVTATQQDATLEVTSGDQPAETFQLQAGLTLSKAKMAVGKPSFKLSIAGKIVLSGVGGLDITNTPAINNFNIYSGHITSSDSGANSSIGNTYVVDPQPSSSLGDTFQQTVQRDTSRTRAVSRSMPQTRDSDTISVLSGSQRYRLHELCWIICIAIYIST